MILKLRTSSWIHDKMTRMRPFIVPNVVTRTFFLQWTLLLPKNTGVLHLGLVWPPAISLVSADSLLARIRKLRGDLDELFMDADALAEKENGGWLTVAQFARLAELESKTISNYLSQGKYGQVKKGEDGYWRIHKSELNHHTRG